MTTWTAACQAPLSMEISRQDYWSRLPFPSPENLLTQGSNLSLLHLLHWQAIFFFFFSTEPPRKPQSTRLSSLGYTVASNWLYLLYTWCVYTSVLLSQLIPTLPTLSISTSLVSMSAFLFLLYKWGYQYIFF